MQSSGPVISLQVDVSSALKVIKNDGMFRERALMLRNDIWHRIKILNGLKYDKEYVLKAILSAIEPADLIPVRYQACSSTDTSFIARNCGPALEKLCKNNLIIKIPNNDPLILVLTLGFASIQDLKVSIQPLLLTSITKRYNSYNKSLDLNNFHREDDIQKNVYCPLSQTRTFTHVLKLTRTTLNSFVHLNLQSNELTNLEALQNSNLNDIKSLDLRYNNLMNMNVLLSINHLPIVELWLDGNPLCENYSTEELYIKSVKKYCPKLLKLDGILLNRENIPLIIDYYFPNKLLKNLIKQFTNHYFILLDQQDKSLLFGLYNKNAIYSLTFNSNGNINTTNRKYLDNYIDENHNILNKNSSKLNSLIYIGQNDIINAIKRLPLSIHDRTTFKYDIIYYNNKTIVIVINGTLKLVNVSTQLLTFNRTFVLNEGTDNEYQILNDQYHIDINVTEFVLSNFDNNLIQLTNYELAYLSPSEKQELINMLKNITSLNDKWSETFLDHANWNLKEAILNFMNAYVTSQLSAEAFN